MKKKYITPSSQTYAFWAESVLALSNGGKVGTYESDPNGTTGGSDALSTKRENPIWNNSLLSND